MKNVCSICDPFNCDCVCARCGEPATTECDIDDDVVSLCAEDCCPAQDGEPCDPPCADCRETEAYYRREWEAYGRREYEQQRTYVRDIIEAGRCHLLREDER